MSLCQRGLLTSRCHEVLVHSLDLYMHFGALDPQPLYPTNLVVCVIFLVAGWEHYRRTISARTSILRSRISISPVT